MKKLRKFPYVARGRHYVETGAGASEAKEG